MALKDCTYTVKIGGKTVTYDYDGLRSFLLDNKNLAAIAPTFAGQKPSSAKATETAPRRAEEGLTFKVGPEAEIMRAKPDVLFTVQPGRKYFTLSAAIRDPRGQYPSVIFLRNLSADPEEAMEEAEAYMRRIATGQVKGAAFSPKEGQFYARDRFKSYGLVAGELKASDLIGTGDERIGQRTMGAGKYADVKVKDLFDTDPDYAFWAATNLRGTAVMRETAEYLQEQPWYDEMLSQAFKDAKAAFTPESRAVLKANRLNAVATGIEFMVSGATRKHKDLLKEVGARYTPESSLWTVGPAGYNKLVERLGGKSVKQDPQSPPDLFGNFKDLVDMSKVPPVQASKHKTAADARKALANLARITEQGEREAKDAYRAMRLAREAIIAGGRRLTKEQETQREKDFIEARDAYVQAIARQRAAAIDEIAPGGLADMSWQGYRTEKETVTTGKYSSEIERTVKGLGEEANRRITEGVYMFRRIVGDHPALRGKKLDVRVLGPGAGDRRERYSLRSIGEEGATSRGHLILTAKAPDNIIVHEMGHWMEDEVPEAAQRIREFLKRRAGNERLSPLSKFEGRGYDSNEFGVKDQFISPYIGKYYVPGTRIEGELPNWERVYASEVLSMGLQYMCENPVKFAREDPEMFDLIFDILRMGR